MAIDNAAVGDMDFTILPSNTLHVEWKDGKGEAEYNDRPGLREDFQDVTFYAPLFQQFMTKLTGITLGQAKKVQIDLINELFENKRQLPYHQVVTAGDFTWEAGDATVTAMSAATIPAAVGGSGSLISQINSLIVDAANSGIVAVGNSLKSDVNVGVVAPANAALSQVNAGVVDPGAALASHIDNVVLGVHVPADPSANTINNRLQGEYSDLLEGDIAHAGVTFTSISSFLSATGAVFQNLVYLSGGAGAGIIPWTPIESATPVNLTATEMGVIMLGITGRRSSLLAIKKNKTNAINALTTVAAVIAYDVTAGW